MWIKLFRLNNGQHFEYASVYGKVKNECPSEEAIGIIEPGK